MKKINNIHIGESTFFFEEDASQILEQYLTHIKELYRDNGEDLKVADVERRIAEFCKERVGENSIVNSTLINEVIESIGIQIETSHEEPLQTDNPAKEQPDENTKNEEPLNDSNEPWWSAMQMGNKIFRNPHEGYVGGVLAGLAAYYGMSVALLRIITIILFIIEPTGLLYLAYIILWAIFPKATSIIDYTRMRHVNTTDKKECMQAMWKNNYKQAIQELAQPPAGGCLATLVKILFFLPLVPFAIAICVFLMAIIVLPLGLMYIFATSGLATTPLLTLPLTIMGISFITAMAVILFAIIHWILKKINICKPMKKWGKIILITLLAASLIFAGIATYGIGKNHDNIENISKKLVDEFNTLLAIANVTSKTGDYYNKFDIDDSSDTVCGAIWYSETEQCGMPLAIESVHNDEGEYNIYFYRTDNIEHDIYNKNYVAKYSLETNNGEYFNDGIYIVWDSTNNSILLDGSFVRDEWGFKNNDNEITEIHESGIKIHFVGFKDSLLYTNATQKGYPAFELRYNENAYPQLYTGGDESTPGVSIPANSTIKRHKGNGYGHWQKATTIMHNGQKDTTLVRTNIDIDKDKFNKAIDDVVDLGNRAENIIKDAHDIVSITATEK